MNRYETAGRRVIGYRSDGSEFVAVELKPGWQIEDLQQDIDTETLRLVIRNIQNGTAFAVSFREAA